jgi:hypothetical protein
MPLNKCKAKKEMPKTIAIEGNNGYSKEFITKINE